ncbi:MAG: ATP-binding protein [Cypionkella sp.]
MSNLLKAVKESQRIARCCDAPILVGLLGVVALVLLYSASQFQTQLGKSRVAASDSRIWSVSQLEVDHRNLSKLLGDYQQATNEHLQSPLHVSKEDVSVAFDVFLSREKIVAHLLDEPCTPAELLAKFSAFDVAVQNLTPRFDALDFTDSTALNRFAVDFEALHTLARDISLAALTHFADDAEAERVQQSMLWARVLKANGILLAMMAAAIFFAFGLRRRMQRQFVTLKGATETIRMIYEASMLAVVVTDQQGTAIFFNTAAEKLFGYSQSDILGRNIAETIIPDHLRARYHKSMEYYRETGRALELEGGPIKTLGLCADGSEVPLELSIRANLDSSGQTTMVIFMRDVSEQLAHETSLREARDEARLHATAKTMFLATMSHEMRTPLHGMLAALELIDEQKLDPRSNDLLHMARECGIRTLQQIDDVLQVSQLFEAVEPLAPVKPVETVTGVIDELTALAKENGNHMRLYISGAADDRHWLAMRNTFVHVMYNLIGNALKFTQNGTVTVTLNFVAETTENIRLHVEVADTGIGISPEDSVRVFDPFVTLSPSVSGALGNHTGLGLSISRIGVEKMGGTLQLASKLGQGSRFFFSIPLSQAAPADLDATQPNTQLLPDATDLSCLVVDDNIVNLSLTAEMLRKTGCNVVEADSGSVAVEKARAEAFDFIFMDVNMPGGLNGPQAAAQIAKDGLSMGAKVIALTADTTFTINHPIGADHFAQVLHKPVNQNDLAQILTKSAGLARPKAHAPLPDAPKPPSQWQDLFDLIGKEKGISLLRAVKADIEDACAALASPDATTADRLHHAIGSTAAVDFADLSRALRQAESQILDGLDHIDAETISAINALTQIALAQIMAVLATD